MSRKPNSILWSHTQVVKRRKSLINKAYRILIELEKQSGHTAVLSVLKKWLAKPLRGSF